MAGAAALTEAPALLELNHPDWARVARHRYYGDYRVLSIKLRLAGAVLIHGAERKPRLAPSAY